MDSSSINMHLLSTMSSYCCDQTKYTVKYLVLILIGIRRPIHPIRSRVVSRSVGDVQTDQILPIIVTTFIVINDALLIDLIISMYCEEGDENVSSSIRIHFLQVVGDFLETSI